MNSRAMSSDRLSLTFAALADPTRRAILESLSRGKASVQELARPFDVSLPAISRHLKVLERAGLIERTREAQWRPCRLTAAPLKEVASWLAHYRRFWEAGLDRLDDYLREIQNLDMQSRATIPKARHRRSNWKGRTDGNRAQR